MSSLRAKSEEVSSEHSSSSAFPTNQTYREQHKSVGSYHPAANSSLDFLYCCTPRSIPLIHLHTTTTAFIIHYHLDELFDLLIDTPLSIPPLIIISQDGES